jgi:hypothetical protein
MSTERIIRFGGLLGLVSGAAWALYEIGEIVGVVPISWDARLDLGAHMLITISVIGLYARQANKAGVLGLFAFVVYMIMAMVNQGMKHIYTYIVPTLSTQFPEAASAIGASQSWGLLLTSWMWLTILAPILLGISFLRANVLPRWAAALIIIGPIISMTITFLPGNVGAVLTSTGFAALGYFTWAGAQEPVGLPQTQPAT